MSLEEIKDTFKSISIKHKLVQSFDYGDFILSDLNHGRVNQVFLEIPYNINYQADGDFKTVQFALMVLKPSVGDDGIAAGDHQALSDTLRIGEEILFRFGKDTRRSQVRITNQQAISIRNFSDADLSGMRFEIELTLSKGVCNNTYANSFSDL